MVIDKSKYVGKFNQLDNDQLTSYRSESEGVSWDLFTAEKSLVTDESLFYALVKKCEYDDEEEFDQYLVAGNHLKINFQEVNQIIRSWEVNFSSILGTGFFENLKVGACILIENDDDLLEVCFSDQRSLYYLTVSIY